MMQFEGKHAVTAVTRFKLNYKERNYKKEVSEVQTTLKVSVLTWEHCDMPFKKSTRKFKWSFSELMFIRMFVVS